MNKLTNTDTADQTPTGGEIEDTLSALDLENMGTSSAVQQDPAPQGTDTR